MRSAKTKHQAGRQIRTAGSEDAFAELYRTSEDIFAELYRNHYPRCVVAAQRILKRRDLAEEACQEAFLKYLDRSCSPQPGREGAYVRRMVVNQALGMLRRQGVEERHLDRTVRNADSAESEALKRVDSEAITQLLDRLPARQRHVIVQQHVVGMSVQEVATRLGISCGATKTHGHRARGSLRTSLTDT